MRFSAVALVTNDLVVPKLSVNSKNLFHPKLSLDPLIPVITIYRSHMNNEQFEPSPLPPFIWVNIFVQSEAAAALFPISPQGWCSDAVRTLLQRYLWTRVRSQRCPPWAKSKLPAVTSWWEHILILACRHLCHLYCSVYLRVTLLFPPLSLSLSLCGYICISYFLPSSPSTLSSPVRFSWYRFLCSCCLSFWHACTSTHTRSQHSSRIAV